MIRAQSEDHAATYGAEVAKQRPDEDRSDIRRAPNFARYSVTVEASSQLSLFFGARR